MLLHNLAIHPILKSKLIAVHVNHGLSPNALRWQSHCQTFTKQLGVRLTIKSVDFGRLANIEEEARKARYKAFATELESEDCLILGHHLDDQAETLLLQLFRGAGVDGLSAMPAQKEFAGASLLRPFLEYSRQTLENYAKAHHLEWINDESNQNMDFSRNYLRLKILPEIDSRWPDVAKNLVRTTKHCQQAQSNLEALAKLDCPSLNRPTSVLPLASLCDLETGRLSNVIRFWFKLNQVKVPDTKTFNCFIKELIQVREDASPKIIWKGNCVRRYQQNLYLTKVEEPVLFKPLIWSDFPRTLSIAGLGQLNVIKANHGLLVPELSQIEIRFRQGGELFCWHGQQKQLKKLFQEWKVPPWLRDRIPLLYINDQLALVVGYAISDYFYGETTAKFEAFELVLTAKPFIK